MEGFTHEHQKLTGCNTDTTVYDPQYWRTVGKMLILGVDPEVRLIPVQSQEKS